MAASKDLGTLFVKLKADTGQFKRAFKDAERQTKQTAQATSHAGRIISGAIKAMGVVAGGFSVKAFSDFDSAMVQSTSIMQVTSTQIQEMRDLALSLSGKVRQSPTELAQSYFFLASAGLDAEKSMGALAAMAKFATAGMFDMARATDLLTDAQTALQMASSNTEENLANLVRISDVLVKANTVANASVEQFAEALTSDAGATGVQVMGDSVEGIVAALAAYASQGKKAAEAGNLYGRAVRLLTSAFMENGKVFEKYQIEVVDKATGQYRKLEEIIKDIEVAIKDMTRPQKTAFLQEIGFEALAQKAILPLLGMSKSIADYRRQLEKAAVFTERVAEKQMTSFANSMRVVWNQVTAVSVSIGQSLAPAIKGLGDLLKDLIAFTQSWSDETKLAFAVIAKMTLTIIALNMALKGLVALGIISWLKTLVANWHLAVAAMASLVVKIGAVIALYAGLKYALKGAAQAQREYNDAVTRRQQMRDRDTAKANVLTEFNLDKALNMKPQDRVGFLQKIAADTEKAVAEVKRRLESARKSLEGAEDDEFFLSKPFMWLGEKIFMGGQSRFKSFQEPIDDATNDLANLNNRLEGYRKLLERTKLELKDLQENAKKVNPREGLETALNDLAGSLQKEIRFFGMDQFEKDFARIKDMGDLTQKELERIATLQAQLDAKRINQQYGDQLQNQQMKKLDDLLARGLITQKIYAKAIEDTRGELSGMGDDIERLKGLMMGLRHVAFGSAEMVSRLEAQRAGFNADKLFGRGGNKVVELRMNKADQKIHDKNNKELQKISQILIGIGKRMTGAPNFGIANFN